MGGIITTIIRNRYEGVGNQGHIPYETAMLSRCPKCGTVLKSSKKRWEKGEIDRLMDLWSKDRPYKLISKMLKNRTAAACRQKVGRERGGDY